MPHEDTLSGAGWATSEQLVALLQLLAAGPLPGAVVVEELPQICKGCRTAGRRGPKKGENSPQDILATASVLGFVESNGDDGTWALSEPVKKELRMRALDARACIAYDLLRFAACTHPDQLVPAVMAKQLTVWDALKYMDVVDELRENPPGK